MFIWKLIVTSRKEHLESENQKIQNLDESPNYSLIKSILFLVSGIFLLKYGADFLVHSSKILAKNFGISDRIIAVTVVAIGTSIPELVTSIIAALKKETNLAVGNLIGSNIFNILAVLGITSCFRKINLDDAAILSFDYLWMIAITLVLGFFIYVFSKQYVSRKEGVFLVLIYISYMWNVIA
jgi:cation:H+ antiporter